MILFAFKTVFLRLGAEGSSGQRAGGSPDVICFATISDKSLEWQLTQAQRNSSLLANI